MAYIIEERFTCTELCLCLKSVGSAYNLYTVSTYNPIFMVVRNVIIIQMTM